MTGVDGDLTREASGDRAKTIGAAPPAVHQVLATLGYGDAIGHEVIGIQQVLRRAGYKSDIFVETADTRLEDLTRDYRELIDESGPETILVHHFSIGSRASRVAFALPGKMILVYHNITPPAYFTGVHPLLMGLCFNGRRELSAYASRCALALGDSEFNREELVELGFAATGVLPVVPSFDHLEVAPNRLLVQDFDDGWTNVLFVGRVIPNKKIEDVIRFFHAYRTAFNPRSRLLLVGSYSGFELYFAMLQKLVVDLGAHDVHFLGHVTNEELAAIYEVADLFLCASEHEGFCVPILEAFHVRVPVVAFAATAVPSTMDGGGVLYERKDPALVAALVHAVVSNDEVYARVLDSQDAALARWRARDFAGLVRRFVTQVEALPPQPAPAITFDFWDQFDLSQRLEELHQYRPAAYRVLRKPEAGNQTSTTDHDHLSEAGSADSRGGTSEAGTVPHPSTFDV
jgi:glycosyltransferase involved in cell wall biosynthesis